MRVSEPANSRKEPRELDSPRSLQTEISHWLSDGGPTIVPTTSCTDPRIIMAQRMWVRRLSADNARPVPAPMRSCRAERSLEYLDQECVGGIAPAAD